MNCVATRLAWVTSRDFDVSSSPGAFVSAAPTGTSSAASAALTLANAASVSGSSMGLSYSGLRVTFSGCGGSARDQRGRRGFTGVESGAGTLPGFRTDSSTLECRLVLRLTDACISIHRDTSAAEASSLNAGFFVTMARVRLCGVRCQFGIGCERRLPSRSGLTENRVVMTH